VAPRTREAFAPFENAEKRRRETGLEFSSLSLFVVSATRGDASTRPPTKMASPSKRREMDVMKL